MGKKYKIQELSEDIQFILNKVISDFKKWRPNYKITTIIYNFKNDIALKNPIFRVDYNVYENEKLISSYERVVYYNSYGVSNEYFNGSWLKKCYESPEAYKDYKIKYNIKKSKNNIYRRVKTYETKNFHTIQGIKLKKINYDFLNVLKALTIKYYGNVYKGISYDINTAYSTHLGEFPVFKFARTNAILRNKNETIIYVHWYELLYSYLKDKINSQELIMIQLLEKQMN